MTNRQFFAKLVYYARQINFSCGTSSLSGEPTSRCKKFICLAFYKMLAVIRTGGKQYLVQPGDKIKIEKLEKKEGEAFAFSDVLLVEKNKKLEIGAPKAKAEVEAKVLRHGKGEKMIVFKYKPKKRYSKKIGHRQPYTEVEIAGIKN